MTLLDYVALYRSLGFSVVPVGRGSKSPAIPWKEYQLRRPTDDEVDHWFREVKYPGVGIVTGKVSGDLVVLDVDVKSGGLESVKALNLEGYPTVTTGSGGQHWYFRSGNSLRNFAGRLAGIDFRGEAGFVVAAPTLHPHTQRPYVLNHRDIRPLPESIARLCQGVVGPERKAPELDPEALLCGVGNGQRNETAARLIGRWFGRGLTREEVTILAEAWNERNQPPLEAGELKTVIDSIERTHSRKNSVLKNLTENPVTNLWWR